MANGTINLTNYLTTKSFHAGSYNAPGDENLISVGICLSGNFTSNPPPSAQQNAARSLVAYLRGQLAGVTAVKPHRHMPGASTACPGNTWASWFPYVAGAEPTLQGLEADQDLPVECVSDAN